MMTHTQTIALTLVAALTLVCSLNAANIIDDFESYADDTAWNTAGQDGWLEVKIPTTSAQDFYRLVSLVDDGSEGATAPRRTARNNSDKAIMIFDGSTAAYGSLTKAADTVGAGTFSMKYYNYPINNAPMFTVYLFNGETEAARFNFFNYWNETLRVRLDNVDTDYASAIGATEIWHDLNITLDGTGKFDIAIDDVTLESNLTLSNGLTSVNKVEIVTANGNWARSFIDMIRLVPDSYTPASCEEVIQYGWNLSADLNGDCYVEWADFGVFASQWQQCTDPAQADCLKPWE